jgi:hypothetical protein
LVKCFFFTAFIFAVVGVIMLSVGDDTAAEFLVNKQDERYPSLLKQMKLTLFAPTSSPTRPLLLQDEHQDCSWVWGQSQYQKEQT